MKKEKDTPYGECPLVGKLSERDEGIFQLQGMCVVLNQSPELKKTCVGCEFFKEIPPASFVCKKYYCVCKVPEKKETK